MPQNLDEALSFLQQDMSTLDLLIFKNKEERNAVANAYEGVGLWMRNTWLRGHRNSALVDYFEKLGISNPEDMSGIILTSLHRKLNHRDIALHEQIEVYIAYWKTIVNCEDNAKKQAVIQYNKHAINSNVTVIMPVDTADGQRNAVLYQCSADGWVFDPKKDLKFTCTIVKKYFINDSSNVFFKVKMTSMNFANTKILMDTVKIGDTINLSLKLLKIL